MDDVKVLNNICSLLDSSSLSESSTWKGLHEQLFKGNIVSKAHQEYSRARSGGGNPAKAFLDCLKINRKEITIQDFISKAISHKRQDIVKELEKYKTTSGVTFMIELQTFQIEKISNLLGEIILGIHGWEYFAEDYGFNRVERRSFQNSLSSKSQWSPTKCLLLDVTQETPSFKLNDLIPILRQIRREDVINEVKEFINNYEKSTQNNKEHSCAGDPPADLPDGGFVQPMQDEMPAITHYSPVPLPVPALPDEKDKENVMQQEEENVDQPYMRLICLNEPVQKKEGGNLCNEFSEVTKALICFIILYWLHCQYKLFSLQ